MDQAETLPASPENKIMKQVAPFDSAARANEPIQVSIGNVSKLDFGFPRKGKFTDADIVMKRPAYLFAEQIESMGLKTDELSRMIDIDNNGVIETEEFLEVVNSLGGAFSEEQLAEIAGFILPKGKRDLRDFEEIIDSIMSDFALYKIKRDTGKL